MPGKEEWVLVYLGSQYKCVEQPDWPVFPDYLSISCGYGLIKHTCSWYNKLPILSFLSLETISFYFIHIYEALSHCYSKFFNNYYHYNYLFIYFIPIICFHHSVTIFKMKFWFEFFWLYWSIFSGLLRNAFLVSVNMFLIFVCLGKFVIEIIIIRNRNKNKKSILVCSWARHK